MKHCLGAILTCLALHIIYILPQALPAGASEPEPIVVQFEKGKTLSQVFAENVSAAVAQGGTLAGRKVVFKWSYFYKEPFMEFEECLKFCAAAGMKPYLETIDSPFARYLLDLIGYTGGATFLRTNQEPLETCDPFVNACGHLWPFYLGRATVADSEKTLTVSVPQGATRLMVAGVGTSLTGKVSLADPSGALQVAARESVMNHWFDVASPKAGEWKAVISGKGEWRVTAFADGVEHLVFNSPMAGPVGEQAVKVKCLEPVGAELTLNCNQYVRGALSTVGNFKLYDDGKHSDDAAGDGVFGNKIQVPQAGVYPLEMVLSGTSKDMRLYRTYIGGDLMPVVGRPNPLGFVREEAPAISFGCLAAKEISATDISAAVDGRPVKVSLNAGAILDNLRVYTCDVSSGALREGEHHVEVSYQGHFVSAWKFSTDLPKSKSVLINEVYPGGKNEPWWAELYAVSGPIDLSTYRLTDMDGPERPLSEKPLTLNAGDYLVVKWWEGVNEDDATGDANGNGVREVYLSGGTPSFDDQLVLKSGQAIVDAVVWRNNDGKINKNETEDNQEILKAGEWDPSDAVLTGERGTSIGRIDAADDNLRTEWSVMLASTPGKLNAIYGRSSTGEHVFGPGGSHEGRPHDGSVVINEIAVDDPSGHWSELYCVDGPVDISHFVLTDGAGLDEILSDKAVTLKPGEYAVVHWAEGVDESDGVGDANKNGVRDLYVSDHPISSTDDGLFLMFGSLIYDAALWTNADDKIGIDAKAHYKTACDAGHWTPKGEAEDVAVRTGRANESIGRMPNGKDGNAQEDWKIQIKPSPGRINESPAIPSPGSILIVEVSPNSPVTDYAKLRVLSGPIDVSNFMLTDLDGDDHRLAEAPVTINTGEEVVVHWAQGRDETDAEGDLNGNGMRDLYLEDSDLSGSDDQLVLMLGEQIYDAVVWTNRDGAMTKEEVSDAKRLIDGGYWRGTVSFSDQSAGVDIGFSRVPIRRLSPAADSNSKEDWQLQTK